MRAIDADALIDDLKHDVAMDQDSLDYEELTDLNREKIQFDKDCKQNAIDLLQHAPTIEPEPHWIPFKRRKPTEEEGTAFDYIMDCKCPEDGQNILVSINIQGHELVQYDTFYGGGGEECYLESGYDLVEEATAWMPLPEPYREEGN